jgi:hypothetical protein
MCKNNANDDNGVKLLSNPDILSQLCGIICPKDIDLHRKLMREINDISQYDDNGMYK